MFNTFVFAQIFNLVNCRKLDNKLNIFEGVLKNRYFIVITLISKSSALTFRSVSALTIVTEIGGWALIAFVGGAAFQVTQIPGHEWGISLALSFVSITLDVLIRCIPTPLLERAFIKTRIMAADKVLPTYRPETAEWNSAITEVDNLLLFSGLRRGRLNALSFIKVVRCSTTIYSRLTVLLRPLLVTIR